jgi:nucleolar pre-ribosomal-associated protein 2
VRAVRALDHGDADTLTDRLDRVCDALEKCPSGSFHAAEEMLLRWLLKNMATGPAANAARFRTSPRIWNILSAVFARIPLFSLAKSLADRRFLSILQQALKDIAAQTPSSQDLDMPDAPSPDSPANPRKRKRDDAPSAGAAIPDRPPDSLQTAEAVFEAVRVLLSRCDAQAQQPVMYRMGAEHVKSLFSSPAVEAMGILVPWLAICNLAVDRPSSDSLKEQPSWLSTFSALWALHLQGAGDPTEVATHLSGPATRLLAKLTDPALSGTDPVVRDRWAKDLRRFLTRNLILPARAAFLTKGSQEVVRIAVEMTSPSAPTTFPVLYDLVSKSPLEHGGKTSKKDYETWLQTVFDALVHAAKNLNRDSRQIAVRAVLELAAARASPLSAASLRGVCKEYGLLQEDNFDWSLLLSVVQLNPDVFLLTDAGKELLDQILAKTTHSDTLTDDESAKAARFIVLIADGYAQGRDLSTFIRVWLQHLTPSRPKVGLQPLWAGEPLTRTVAKLIQTSLNPNQLVDILDWLSSQTQPGQGLARIHILDSISSGLSREEFIDAASMKTFEGAFLEEYSKKEPPSIAARRWMVAARAISRGTLDEAGRVWARVRSDVKSKLKKQPVEREDVLAAFKCCAAAWRAHHPGAKYEEDAAGMLCAFVDRLLKDGGVTKLDLDASISSSSSVSKETYISWILAEEPRILGLVVDKHGKVPDGLLSLLTVSRSGDEARLDSALAVSRLLMDRESNVNNPRLMDLLLDVVISMIDPAKAKLGQPQAKVAMRFLLDVPDEAMSRAQREAAMKLLVSQLLGQDSKGDGLDGDTWRLVLSLMIKLMSRPTFYEVHNSENQRIVVDHG